MKITIASGKGGTGKTTVSSNLAAYLASLGEQVVLADLDVEEPNSALFLQATLADTRTAYKMIPQWDAAECLLCGKCEEVCSFNAILHLPEEIRVFSELCHSCYACSELCPTSSLPMTPVKIGVINEYRSERFSMVEGRLDLGQEMAIPLIAQTMAYVDEKFPDGIKLYDAPPGTSCPVIEASRYSNLVILITEATPFGLNDLKLAVETMRVLEKDIGVIINRYGIGDDGVERYCQEENIPIITKIQNDREIAKRYSNGDLLYDEVAHFKDALDEILAFIGELR